MKCYPPHTRFFINTWTWGYEDILKAIARAFDSKVRFPDIKAVTCFHTIRKIHVDRYKHDVYTSISDQELRALATVDMKNTRFHACERFSRCEMVRYNDPGVVYVNPMNMSTTHYELYLAHTTEMLQNGELPSFLVSFALAYSHLTT